MKRFNKYLPLTSLACVFCLSASAAADLVIRDVDLIDVTKRQVQHSVTIVIESGRISQVVAAEALDVEVDVGDATVIGGSGLVAMPGFVNAHTHAAMTLFRGLADDLPLEAWLHEGVWPAERRWVSAEMVRDGAGLAIAEMLRAGITCFSDQYFFPEIVAEAAADVSMRAVVAGVRA